MKKDIFYGKIKNEYFSYILGYMIFFVLLFVGVGALCMYASIWGMTTNTSGERLLIAALGVIAFTLALVYMFLELLVIRRFPKYKKLRRVLFNSDCYFAESNSKEYYGRHRRRDIAAFELITSFAEAEKGMGNKKPIQYKIYSALVILMCMCSGASLVAMVILGDNDAMRPEWLQDDSVLCFLFISIAVICIALAIFFLLRAYKLSLMAPFENDKWEYGLYTSLVNISVRKNDKKLKFWYDADQLEQIENLVKSASDNAELKLKTKGNKFVSFTVVDTLNRRVMFTGLFI